MKKIIIDEVIQELDDAYLYYEDLQHGLGEKLYSEFTHYVAWITDNPITPRLRKNGYRRVNLNIFPYYLAYIIRSDTIWIMAFAHQHRSPEYWISRQ